MTASRTNRAIAWRRHAPRLAAFFGRATDTVDVALFIALFGVAASLFMYGVAPLIAAQIALFVWALATLLRLVTRRAVDAVAYPIAATLVLAALTIDRIHYAFFRQHVTLAIMAQAVDAIRARALRVSWDAVGVAAICAVLVTIVLAVLLKALALIPRSPRAGILARSAAVPVLLAIGAASTIRQWAADPRSDEAPAIDARDRAGALFGDVRPFDDSRRHRDRLLATPLGVRARSRPDILIVHVESLRADMLRPDVAPNLVALAKDSLTTPHHYTTGTNTGTGVFGLLTGMNAPSFPLARAAHAQPIPIEILKRLGYAVSVFFSAEIGAYDELYALHFKGLADFTYDGPTQPVWEADARMMDKWTARLREASADVPRFDYVILDSSHYDYSYPPEFERFTPALTLDLGVRDGITVEDGIVEKVKWRAPFVRNRYQNSILYADSIVAKMLDVLRETGRFDRTFVVVTGDHGEEFFEHGTFGHGFYNLSNEQSQVPLVMHLPGVPLGRSTRYRYSSHADVFPTIFDAMGLESLGATDAPFMNGKSLLRFEPFLDVAVVGFGVALGRGDVRSAVVGDGLKVYFRNVPPFEVSEVVTDSDEPIAIAATDPRVSALVFRAIAMKGLR